MWFAHLFVSQNDSQTYWQIFIEHPTLILLSVLPSVIPTGWLYIIQDGKDSGAIYSKVWTLWGNRPLKICCCLGSLLWNAKIMSWSCEASSFSPLFLHNLRPSGSTDFKFWMFVCCKIIYKICMKYFLYVNNYICCDCMGLWDFIKQINSDGKLYLIESIYIINYTFVNLQFVVLSKLIVETEGFAQQ